MHVAHDQVPDVMSVESSHCPLPFVPFNDSFIDASTQVHELAARQRLSAVDVAQKDDADARLFRHGETAKRRKEGEWS